jgi:hypothetical protein
MDEITQALDLDWKSSIGTKTTKPSFRGAILYTKYPNIESRARRRESIKPWTLLRRNRGWRATVSLPSSLGLIYESQVPPSPGKRKKKEEKNREKKKDHTRRHTNTKTKNEKKSDVSKERTLSRETFTLALGRKFILQRFD